MCVCVMYIYMCMCIYIYIQSYLWLVGSDHCKKALSHTLDLTFRGEEWATAPAPPAGHVFFPNDRQLWDGYHCPPKVRSRRIGSNQFHSKCWYHMNFHMISILVVAWCCLMLVVSPDLGWFGMIITPRRWSLKDSAALTSLCCRPWSTGMAFQRRQVDQLCLWG